MDQGTPNQHPVTSQDKSEVRGVLVISKISGVSKPIYPCIFVSFLSFMPITSTVVGYLSDIHFIVGLMNKIKCQDMTVSEDFVKIPDALVTFTYHIRRLSMCIGSFPETCERMSKEDREKGKCATGGEKRSSQTQHDSSAV